MTIYKLPDNLGGREVDCTLYEKDGNTWAWFALEGDWMVHVRVEALTEVKPPLPEEPTTWTVVLDRDGDAWQRIDPDRHGPTLGGPVDKNWYCRAAKSDWALLHADFGPLTMLVVDPLTNAPELPFDNDGDAACAVGADGESVQIFVRRLPWPASEAEQIGLAILRAVKEARVAS